MAPADPSPTLGYTILYVKDVAGSLAFYEQAFGLSRRFLHNEDGKAYGELETGGILIYSNAGHNPPFLMEADGKVHFEERGGVPLGMFRDTRYYEYFANIEPGQVLVLYTDGVTEATNRTLDEYGRDRLVEAVRQCRHLGAREMIDYVHRDVLNWTEGLGATDDVTFFIIKAL